MIKMLLITTVLFIPAQLWCDTLFYDDFSTPALSFSQWLPVFEHDSGKVSYAGGAVKLVNKHPGNSAILLHTVTHPADTLDVSAMVISQFPGSGLFVCLEWVQSGYYNGYGIILGVNEVLVDRWYEGASVGVAVFKAEKINSDRNEIRAKIANDSCFVSLNGVLLGGFAHTSGARSFALFVGPSLETSFDNCLVINDRTSGQTFVSSIKKDGVKGEVTNGAGSAIRVNLQGRSYQAIKSRKSNKSHRDCTMVSLPR